MNLKSFFWQVFLAIALICASSLALYHVMLEQLNVTHLAVLATALPTFVVALFMSWRLSRPLQQLQRHLRKMAEGDVLERLNPLRTQVAEINALANSMTKVQEQLRKRLQFITNQKNEQDALLASMVEGVLAIDENFKILHLNRAAGLILNIPFSEAIGRSIYDTIRVTEALIYIEESLTQSETLERDIIVEDGNIARFLQLHITPMIVEASGRGVVVVFSDVTRLRELEEMRKEFVSNVSHELRTPLTSIQGFAETLLNPAVKEPAEIQKFLTIIQRHATRLGRIIEDILTLSRIEKDTELAAIELVPDKVNSVVLAAIELCEIKAQKKKIKIDFFTEGDFEAGMDRYLLEQAVVNLIDNAIRYSDEGKKININVKLVNDEILISVTDEGVGIPERHLTRVFERFYRVDKARSRELGGTGLGLSIVKHISIAHHGSVEVQSKLGFGSAFTIHLPLFKNSTSFS